MKISGNILSRTRHIVFPPVVWFLLILLPMPLAAGQVSLAIPVNEKSFVIETGLQPLAYDSDSIFCGDRILRRGEEYQLNVHSGRLELTAPPPCDTLFLTAFQIPRWLASPAGNPVPQGKRLLEIKTDPQVLPRPPGTSPRKISLSGNKSFSFTVGRSGEGRFSQGLNVDFDARMADDLRLRGSVSDRGGSGNQMLSGEGETMILSELDKYFFEIEGKKITARGGDITTTDTQNFPAKRIKGVYAAFAGGPVDISMDLGRPAGKFVSQKIGGLDGRQGPYQAVGTEGVPTGIVPGSEKLYLDGRLLEGGADKHYLIDYPSGRITFSPRILITSRTRIELDFEAATNDYEQVIYDAASGVRLWNGKLKFSAGGRRETENKDKLRFGSLSATDIELLRQTGDTASRAFTSGVAADTAGNYQLLTDTLGNEYYLFVGSGAGNYSVSFSFVGEAKGDYRYLGDDIFQYAGKGTGEYLPIRYLPLPARNDFFFSALEVTPYRGGVWRLEYQGNNRDNNLFSTFDDGDNLKSRIVGMISNVTGSFSSMANIRFRQDGYDPVYRVDPPDDIRLWAMPSVRPSGDELRFDLDNHWKTTNNHLGAEFGLLSLKNNLRSNRWKIAGQLLISKTISPHFDYQSGNSELLTDSSGMGLYEMYNTGLSIKAAKRLRLEFDFDRELVKNGYDSIPDIEKYLQYKGAVFMGRSVMTASRRVEYRSGQLGFKGPQQDKIELTSEESFGRLQVTLAGTWFHQKKLDSDREDRTERLFITAFRYAPASAWMTLQAEYRQNRQSVRATGYRYIKVNSGEGDYRLEDNQYLFDPDGDYIRIREERGGAASVSVGEKNHNITLYPGRMPALLRYQAILSQVAFRLRTEIIDEMPGKDCRTLAWALPWASRSGIQYIKRIRRERYAWLLFPMYNFYILNFTYGNSFEEQESGGQIYRSNKDYDAELKSQLSPVVRTRFEWLHRRSDESGASAIAMNLKSNTYTVGLIVNPSRLQITPGVSLTQFSDDYSGGEGSGVILSLEAIWRQPEKGEIRLNTELRSLTEKFRFTQPEYLVTDGRRFGKSALVNLVINYEISKSWRLTVNLTDRIYEDRPAEFVGRGELLARF